MSVIFGNDYETARCSNRDSIHVWRATSFIFGLVMKSFTVMTWTPDSTLGWRDLSVIIGLISEWLDSCLAGSETHEAA
jgi:hypothetical protein